MKKVKSFSFIALAVALLVGCSNTSNEPSNQESQVAYQEMAGEDLDKIEEDDKDKEKYLVIDVRDEKEYKEGHVKHAINIPVGELEGKLGDLEAYKDKEVVTVCNTGKKSAEAAEILANNGFTKVSNAQGVKDFTYTTLTKAGSLLGAKFDEMVKSGNYTVIDVRDKKDYEKGHMKDAIHTTVDTYVEDIKNFPTDKPFLTYCYSGNRSWKVADELAKQGHEVYNAFDGTKEYDGYELVK